MPAMIFMIVSVVFAAVWLTGCTGDKLTVHDLSSISISFTSPASNRPFAGTGSHLSEPLALWAHREGKGDQASLSE